MKLALVASVLVAAIDSALGHGDGRDHEREQAERRLFLEMNTGNSLEHCADKIKRSGLYEDAARRRYKRAAELMHPTALEAAIQARQTSSIGKSHKSDKAFTAATDPALIFAGGNSCVLSPQATEGPFCKFGPKLPVSDFRLFLTDLSADVMGESVRSDIVETQAGIPLHIDFQIFDVTTCKPIEGTFFEMWSESPLTPNPSTKLLTNLPDANGTGVYSGALSPVNGLSGVNDKANLDRTYLRGSQLTDKNGVVQFNTIFPGHYDGRAPHIHVVSHTPKAEAQANNTLWHTKATYAGQLFFDQDIVDNVKKVAPYSGNRQNLMKNAADNILKAEAQYADPFFNYVLLGKDLSAGVFAWYQIGINQTFTRDIMAAAMKYKEGGKMNTGNPKGGLEAIFPGGFPTAFQPGSPQPPRYTGKPQP